MTRYSVPDWLFGFSVAFLQAVCGRFSDFVFVLCGFAILLIFISNFRSIMRLQVISLVMVTLMAGVFSETDETWLQNNDYTSIFMIDANIPENDTKKEDINEFVQFTLNLQEHIHDDDMSDSGCEMSGAYVCVLVFFPPLDRDYGKKVKFYSPSHFIKHRYRESQRDVMFDYAANRNKERNISKEDELRQPGDKRFGLVDSPDGFRRTCWKPIEAGWPVVRLSIRKVDEDPQWEEKVKEILPLFNDSKPGLLLVVNSYGHKRRSPRKRALLYDLANISAPIWSDMTSSTSPWKKWLRESCNFFRNRLDSCSFKYVPDEACYWGLRRKLSPRPYRCRQRLAAHPNLTTDHPLYPYCYREALYYRSELCADGTMCEKVCQNFTETLKCNVTCGKGVQKIRWIGAKPENFYYDFKMIKNCPLFDPPQEAYVNCTMPDCVAPAWIHVMVWLPLSLLILIAIAAPIVIYFLFWYVPNRPKSEKKYRPSLPDQSAPSTRSNEPTASSSDHPPQPKTGSMIISKSGSGQPKAAPGPSKSFQAKSKKASVSFQTAASLSMPKKVDEVKK